MALKLAVNNRSLYNYHQFVANVRHIPKTGKYEGRVSVWFFTASEDLYSVKELWVCVTHMELTSRIMSGSALERYVREELEGKLHPDVAVEVNRKINLAGK